MGIARVASRAQLGLSAPRVEVEVHLGGGLPTFSIVGLPATAVKESKDRVRAALAEFRLRMAGGPHHGQSLARGSAQGGLPLRPAHRARHPAGVVAARDARNRNWRTREFYGELGLAGELKPIKGVLLAAAHAAREGRALVVPAANVGEARIAAPSTTQGADTLLGVCALARGDESRGCRRRKSPAGWPVHFPARPGSICRCARPGGTQTRTHHRGGGWTQPVVRRSAGHRQEHARATPAGPAARARWRRRTRRRLHRLGEHARLCRGRLRPATVPRAASHRVGRRHHRRRTARAARRSQPRASRRVVPR